MKKTISITIVVVLVLAGGIYYFMNIPAAEPVINTGNQTGTQANISTFKTYTDSDTGFTIKYPSQYTVVTQTVPAGGWKTRTLLVIDDNPNAEQTMTPRAIPGSVNLMRQPVAFANGKIYHTVAEFQQSGVSTQLIQGVINPNGDLVTVNGSQALLFHSPRSDYTGITTDSYYFIKDNLIFEVGINVNDPYKDEILNSISWNK